MGDQEPTEILNATGVKKWYLEDDLKKVILDDISISIKEGEFVAILGPSGSGKSTFLRTLAGLIPCSEGQVSLHGKPLTGVNPNTAIVFQTFALYPWLTVRKNVELGLLASNLSDGAKNRRITDALRVIGLEGFENAYPKEISGGMKQRVGFARALVVQPEILMMDEPFSALDVLTAENLRRELLSLWSEKKIPTKAILMVTHNIAEAVSMADRLFVLSANPGRIRIEVPGLPLKKRAEDAPERAQLVDAIYQIMTNPKVDAAKLLAGAEDYVIPAEDSPYQLLPQIHLSGMRELLERVRTSDHSQQSLQLLGRSLPIEQLMPLIELIDLLGFGGVENGNLVLTGLGRKFAESSRDAGRAIMRDQLLANVSTIQFIVKAIDQNPKRTLKLATVRTHLRHYFVAEDAESQLRSTLTLGLYSNIIKIDRTRDEVSLKSVQNHERTPA